MNKMRRIIKYVGPVVVATGCWIAWHQSSSAQGAPPLPTIAYSGYLENAGTPINGTRSIGVSLWKANSTANASDRVCLQEPSATTVALGWFTVALGAECIGALRASPSLFLEFTVDTADFPLQAIGAVPYALRALEYNNGSRLRRIVIKGADGSKQDDPTRWWDTLRNEECKFSGTGATKLCLPFAALAATGGGSTSAGTGGCFPILYGDTGCTQPFSLPAGSWVGGTFVWKYVTSATSSSGLATVTSQSVQIGGCGSCTAATLYSPGQDLDAALFVSGTETHE
jgi:hypothetical protein